MKNINQKFLTWKLILLILISASIFSIDPCQANPYQNNQNGRHLSVSSHKKFDQFDFHHLRSWDILVLESDNIYYHVVLIDRDESGELFVLEASPIDNVRKSPLRDYIKLSVPNSTLIFALRAQTKFQMAMKKAQAPHHLAEIFSGYQGHPYNFSMRPDHTFPSSNGKSPIKSYYCSQLVRDLFNEYLLKEGLDIMPLQPMEFKWKFAIELVKSRGYEVPEGLPGCSPMDFATYNFDFLGQISLSNIH